MRDNRKSKEYFEKYLEYQRERIQKKESKLQECQGDTDRAQRIYRSLMNYQIDLYFAEFSYGAEKERLGEILKSMLETACAMDHPDYETLLNLLSISIVMDCSEYSLLLDKLLNKQNSVIHDDKLLNLFACFIGGNELSWRGSFVSREVYGELDHILGNDIEVVLEKYLAGWYVHRKDMAWYDSHKGTNDTYVGYWSFEAAALAIVFDVDDQRLKNSPYYPVVV
ncbi:MAG: DUF1911 domain-containing protein [Clostridiales bacterium]|nr:DUF1911 domain-containing protein [Clostridiales bacterium]